MNKVDKIYQDRDKWKNKCIDLMAKNKSLKFQVEMWEFHNNIIEQEYQFKIDEANDTIEDLHELYDLLCDDFDLREYTNCYGECNHEHEKI